MGSDKLLRLKNLEKAIDHLKRNSYDETVLIFTGFNLIGETMSDFPVENIHPQLLIDLFQKIHDDLRKEILIELGAWNE